MFDLLGRARHLTVFNKKGMEAEMTRTTLLILLTAVTIIGFIGYRKAKREFDNLLADVDWDIR